MTGMGMGSTYLERPRPSGLAEVIDIILDKGLVIDVFLRVSVLGLELLTVDARIVVASIDTYLRFAEAVDRVTLQSGQGTRLADLFGTAQEEGARARIRGGVGGAIEGVKESIGVDQDSDQQAEQPARREERVPRRNGRSGR